MRFIVSILAVLSLVACSDAPTGDAAGDASTDPANGPVDDTGSVVDVSEAFCDCDDDCLPLGDGSVCNGTVCTFGVPGTPCGDAGDVSDADPDATTDVASSDVEPESDVTPDVTVDAGAPDVPEPAGLTVTYETTGGFTGEGERDIRLIDGHMWIDEPFITDCDADLTTDQLTRLIDAAAVVDWASMDDSYRPPDNPTCCCDQFIYTLTITTDSVGSGTVMRAIDWCDESVGDLLPFAIDTFIAYLNDVADEVYAACE